MVTFPSHQIEEDAYQEDLGFSLGHLGKSGSGRVRQTQVNEATKARISKTLQVQAGPEWAWESGSSSRRAQAKPKHPVPSPPHSGPCRSRVSCMAGSPPSVTAPRGLLPVWLSPLCRYCAPESGGPVLGRLYSQLSEWPWASPFLSQGCCGQPCVSVKPLKGTAQFLVLKLVGTEGKRSACKCRLALGSGWD